MKKLYIFFLVLLSSCSPNRESLPAPERVMIYPVPEPLSEVDIGSGAIPEVDGIKIMWGKVENSAGYKIYRGVEKVDKVEFDFYRDVRVQAGIADTFFIDTGVEFRKRYFYFVRAYNRDNVEGQPSDTISFELYPKPNLISPGNNSWVSADTLTFRWDDPSGGGDFVIRVKDAQTESLIWIYSYRSFYDFSVRFNIDSKARGSLISGRQYKWRVDRVQFDQNAGSKSKWGVFYVK